MQILKIKFIVITGASSGLGETTARHLSALGGKLVLAARRTDRLNSLVDDITQQGGEAIAVAPDVTNKAQVEALIKAAVEHFGRVDVLLNNAGFIQQSRLDSAKTDEWEKNDRYQHQGDTLWYCCRSTLYAVAKKWSYH